jgi:formylglycine-generating enzyme required for sulfatase activity
MSEIFGIDFGTTNTIATYILTDHNTGKPIAQPLRNLDDHRPHPSVLCYDGTAPKCGRSAKSLLGNRNVGVTGNFVRSPKMFLGSRHGIDVGGVMRDVTDVVADYFRFIRQDALARNLPDRDFSHAVFTIPVSMDGLARARLRTAALKAKLHIHQFVHEPLAALYGYLRSQPDCTSRLAQLENRMMLVFDWGGGTLDLTLVQMTNGVLAQIENAGSYNVGGDQFDLRLKRLVQDRHVQQYPKADWNKVQSSAESRLIEQCEEAKIKLSETTTARAFIRNALIAEGRATDVSVEITRAEFEKAVEDLIDHGLGKIQELLQAANVPLNGLEFCLATGGMVAMPAIRNRLQELFGINRLRLVDNSDTIISEGAAWIAYDRAVLCLAKPLELVHAGNTYMPLFNTDMALPTENTTKSRKFLLYSTDPRDGFAKLQFVRSRRPGKNPGNEIRKPYNICMLPIDYHAAPFYERLNLELIIDHDLVAKVKASSEGRGTFVETEIFDLEFGLGVPESIASGNAATNVSSRPGYSSRRIKEIPASKPCEVQVRSNVSEREDHELIPGDIAGGTLTTRQRDEKGYYFKCVDCGRTIFQIEEEGCDKCAAKGLAPSCTEAQKRRKRSAGTSGNHLESHDETLPIREIVLKGEIKLELLYCPAGTFTMGSPVGEKERERDETQHKVILTKPFWMGSTEVTQAQWSVLMENNPSSFKGDDLPVDQVSFTNAVLFCKKLTAKALAAGKLPTGYEYRLPTEAEWEYACRAGNLGPCAGSGRLREMGWYEDNSEYQTQRVGQKQPNAWGLYDMHGNVSEWCIDGYGDYPSETVTDPKGSAKGVGHVFRGGSWYDCASDCRSGSRFWIGSATEPNDYLGFRVTLAPKLQ